MSDFGLSMPVTIHYMRPDPSKPARLTVQALRLDTPQAIVETLAKHGPFAGVDTNGMPFLAEHHPTGVLFTTARGEQPQLPALVLIATKERS